MSLHPIFQEIIDRQLARPKWTTPNRWRREFADSGDVAKYMRAYHAYPLMPEAPLNSPEMHGYFDAEKEADLLRDEQAEKRNEERDE